MTTRTAHRCHGNNGVPSRAQITSTARNSFGAPGAGNVATNAGRSGGGLALLGASTLQATNLTFIDNRCNYSGGGLFVSNATASLLGLPGDPAEDFAPPNRFSGNQATNASLGRGGRSGRPRAGGRGRS